MTTQTTGAEHNDKRYRLSHGQIGELTLKLLEWKPRIEKQRLTIAEITNDLQNVLPFKVVESSVRDLCKYHNIAAKYQVKKHTNEEIYNLNIDTINQNMKSLEERVSNMEKLATGIHAICSKIEQKIAVLGAQLRSAEPAKPSNHTPPFITSPSQAELAS